MDYLDQINKKKDKQTSAKQKVTYPKLEPARRFNIEDKILNNKASLDSLQGPSMMSSSSINDLHTPEHRQMTKSTSKATLSKKKLNPIDIKTMGYLASSESLPTLKSVDSQGLFRDFQKVDTMRSVASLKSIPSVKSLPKLNPQVQKFAQPKKSEDQLFEMPEKVKCLFKNRPLCEFDTLKNDYSPEEIMARCKALDSNQHAQTKVQENQKQVMRPCEVFHQEKLFNRFHVRMLSNGMEKEVQRTNLFFVWEEKKNYDARMAMAEQLRSDAESNYKFDLFVNLISKDKVYSMDKELKTRLFNTLVDSLPGVDITQHIDQVVALKKDLELYQVWGQKRFLFHQHLNKDHELRSKMRKTYYLQQTPPVTENKTQGILQVRKSAPKGSLYQVEQSVDQPKDKIEKIIATLCSEFLDKNLVELDPRYHKVPMNLRSTPTEEEDQQHRDNKSEEHEEKPRDLEAIIQKNYEDIKQRLDRWRNKINEELKMQQVGKCFDEESRTGDMSQLQDETVNPYIKHHILKINLYIRNKLAAYLKDLFDNSINFLLEFRQLPAQFESKHNSDTYIKNLYELQPANIDLHDNLDIQKLKKPLQFHSEPLLHIVIRVSEGEGSDLKNLLYYPRRSDVFGVFRRIQECISDLAQTVDKIDLKELNLRDANLVKIMPALAKDDSYRWYETACKKLDQLTEESMKYLTANLLKYKDQDSLFSIHEGQIYNTLNDWVLEEIEEEDEKDKKKKKELSQAEIKDKFKKHYKATQCRNPPVSQLMGEVKKYEDLIQSVLSVNPIKMKLGLFKIDSTEMVEKTHAKCQMILKEIYSQIEVYTKNEYEQLLENYTSIIEKLKSAKEDEKTLRDVETQLKTDFDNHILENEAKYENANDLFEVIEKKPQLWDSETHKLKFKIQEKICEIQDCLNQCKKQCMEFKFKLNVKLEKEIFNFKAKLKDLHTSCMDAMLLNEYKSQKKTCNHINELNATLNEFLNTSINLEDRCKFLGYDLEDPNKEPPTKEIQSIIDEEFKSYKDLWNLIDGWKDFFKGVYEDMDISELQNEGAQNIFGDKFALALKFKRQFESQFEETGEEPPIMIVAKTLQEEMSEFNLNFIPLIEHLGIKAIKDDHWVEIIREFNFLGMKQEEIDEFETKPENASTKIIEQNVPNSQDNIIKLKYIGKLDVSKCLLFIEEVSSKARKQQKIEVDIMKIDKQLKEANLVVEKQKESGEGVQFQIIKEIDNIMQDLDDKIQNLQGMKNQADITPKLKVEAMQKCMELERFTQVIDLWVKFQKNWLSLEPVFTSDDIKEKLSEEYKKFDFWNKYFIDTMKTSYEDPKVQRHVSEGADMLDKMTQGVEALDHIQKKLESQLNSKRQVFARFFFLSDESLLEILAQTKDPLRVQPHVGKCIEGIDKLFFEKQNNVISKIISPEKEEVHLKETVRPEDPEMKGNVEKWMQDLELKMKKSMAKLAFESKTDFITRKDDYLEWVKRWPAMSCISVDQWNWTSKSEIAIENMKKNKNSLKDFEDVMNGEIHYIVKKVRTKLSSNDKRKLGAICTLKVHNREIIESYTQEFNPTKMISDIRDFRWQSQLRQYFGNYPNYSACESIQVRMVDSRIQYDYEYLGNSMRLVVTPLTDRCYRTLLCALQLQQGGGPEGPAGTGKTESVKDLAKALAIQCVVMNCSNSIDHIAMCKFFKGLCGTGAWCTFDEFNRILVEVLSVIAMQIGEIMNAVKANKKTFTFFGYEDTKIIVSCFINITMNPGQAGRAELPDNLKALFRPVAMMVPDQALISEIRLQSFGFEASRRLAVKLVKCLSLSSEQLSPQFHQDFGMRTVTSILLAASNNRNNMPNETEDIMCLKALYDVNIPKFLANDIPLFKDITRDLFPGQMLPDFRKLEFENSIRDCCKKMDLIASDKFMEKCNQLLDTNTVRHGYMIVGDTCVGKTKTLKAVQDALGMLDGQDEYKKVLTLYLNPKSVKQEQLQGMYDERTNEFAPGVIPKLFKQFIDQEDVPALKWIIMDGPVDAEWIEDMNSVLDDNKKLCLASGDSLKLKDDMRIIFEVEDLIYASPATISRCGMVQLEIKYIGYQNLLDAQLMLIQRQLTTECEEFEFSEEKIEGFQNIIRYIMVPLIEWWQKVCQPPIEFNSNTLIFNYFRLFKLLIKERQNIQQDLDDKAKKKVDKSKFEAELKNLILFSQIWSFGSLLNLTDRIHYNKFLNEIVKGKTDVNEEYKLYISPKVWKHEETVCTKMQIQEDYFLNTLDQTDFSKFVKWESTVEKTQLDVAIPFNEIFVSTKETITLSFFFNFQVKQDINMLVSGNTGTGKTRVVMTELINISSDETNKKVFLPIAFSAQTSVSDLQSQLEGFLPQRLRKDNEFTVFGPADGKKGIVFIDDVNLPEKEKQNAQPPIELIRQWMDYKGWFFLESEDKEFVKYDRLQFCGTFGPLRNVMSNRMVRHFSQLQLNAQEEDSLKKIFQFTIDQVFTKNEIKPDLHALKNKIVDSTIQLQEDTSKTFKPKPSTIHQVYNLRDVTRVFLGINLGDKIGLQDKNQVIKLWFHESERIFSDRLLESDLPKFKETITDNLKKGFGESQEKISNKGMLMFGKFCPMTIKMDGQDRKLVGKQCELFDLKLLKDKCYQLLNDYNSNPQKKKMDLVLFDEAIKNLSRICRVMTLPSGHGVMVGNGGSGRKSLIELATSIMGMESFKVELKKIMKEEFFAQWKAYLQLILYNTGVAEKQMVFQLQDRNIIQENMLEDISNILNNGEVPNLFDPKKTKIKVPEQIQTIMKDGGWKRDEILGEMQAKLKARGQRGEQPDSVVWNAFIEGVKQNLHIVVVQSPSGEEFRFRMRSYPNLINCATINWFHPWPRDALIETAYKYLNQLDIDKTMRENLVDICCNFHTSVRDLCIRQKQEDKRFFYATPTSQLELLSNQVDNFKKKFDDVNGKCQRQVNGVKKIEEAENTVQVLEAEIKKLEPEVNEKKGQCEIDQEKIKIDKDEADAKGKIVAVEKEKVDGESKMVKEKAESIESVIAEAEPFFKSARKDIEALKESDLKELFSQAKPSVKLNPMLEVFIDVYSIRTTIVEGKKIVQEMEEVEENGKKKKQKSIYKTSQNINKSCNLKSEMISISKDIAPKLKEYPDLMFEVCKKQKLIKEEDCKNLSNALVAIWKFVGIMTKQFEIDQELEPNRRELEEKQARLKVLLAELDKLNNEQNSLVEKVARLEADLASKIALLKELEDTLNLFQSRKKVAVALTEGLKSEKKSWLEAADSYSKLVKNVEGDVLISCGVASQLGAFTKGFRDSEINKWLGFIKEKGISTSEGVTLEKTLGDPIKVQEWSKQELPTDPFTVENTVIMHFTDKYTLSIDPQNQANSFIKNKAPKGAFIKQNAVTSNPEGDMKNLKRAITRGQMVLIENVQETINVALEPLLNKQFTKKGSNVILNLENEDVDVDPNFVLYMTTTLPRPHQTPEVCIMIKIINQTATPDGLTDQMCNTAIETVDPNIYSKNMGYTKRMAEFKMQEGELTINILTEINDETVQLLDKHQLVKQLSESQDVAKKKKKYMSDMKQVKNQFGDQVDTYKNVSMKVANLQFVVSDMNVINVAYMWSLEWFRELYIRAIRVNPDKEKIEGNFRSLLQESVCISLFEKDKLLFSFLMAIKLMTLEDIIDNNLIRFLFTGGVRTEFKAPFPEVKSSKSDPNEKQQEETECSNWFTRVTWTKIEELNDTIPVFKGYLEKFKSSILKFNRIFEDSPVAIQKDLPHVSDIVKGIKKDYIRKNKCNFLKLILIRVCRPELFVRSIKQVLEEYQGSKKFVEAPPFNLSAAFETSNPQMPIIFILSTGADPLAEIIKFSREKGKKEEDLPQMSLGRGQEKKADKGILDCRRDGKWIVLQNCHMCPSFMPILENRIVETTNKYKSKLNKKKDEKNEDNDDEPQEEEEQVHDFFRFWVTTMPTSEFPTYVMQNSIKLTYEPPKGIKSNMIRCYNIIEPEYFSNLAGDTAGLKLKNLQKLVFALTLFHGVLLERKRFGPLGWNIQQGFSLSDFQISKDVLKSFMSGQQLELFPFDALNYMTSEANYGGKVTDGQDRNSIVTIIKDQFTPDLFKEHPKKIRGIQEIPNLTLFSDWKTHVMKLDEDLEMPELFGIHKNGNITSQKLMTNQFIGDGIQTIPRGGGSGGVSMDQILEDKCKELLEELPEEFKVEDIERLKPVSRDNSMNTVLIQDSLRYNRLIIKIQSTVNKLKRAIVGLEIMDNTMDILAGELLNNVVPSSWLANNISYPTMKPLGFYYRDLIKRLNCIKDWIQGEQPVIFWLPMFHFTQSFNTGIQQNYSRKFDLEIDTLSMVFKFIKQEDVPLTRPVVGEQVSGLQMEGGKWNMDTMMIDESELGKLFQDMPIIHFIPVINKKYEGADPDPKRAEKRFDFNGKDYYSKQELEVGQEVEVEETDEAGVPQMVTKMKSDQNVFSAPCYKTSARKGTLSTTGHSTNFIMSIDCPIPNDQTSDSQVKKGLALLTTLDDE